MRLAIAAKLGASGLGDRNGGSTAWQPPQAASTKAGGLALCVAGAVVWQAVSRALLEASGNSKAKARILLMVLIASGITEPAAIQAAFDGV